MDTPSASLEELREIRRLMEKSSRFLSLSGLSGISAGLFALIGAGIAYWYLDRGNLQYDENFRILDNTRDVHFIRFLIIDASCVLIFALLSGYYFSKRRAAKMGIKFWNAAARQLLINLFIPLIAGGLVLLIFLLRSQVNYLAPFTMIFYGLGLVNAGKYSYSDIYYLGIAEVLLGVATLLFLNHGLLFWAVGFGVFHIIYGLVLYFKYEYAK